MKPIVRHIATGTIILGGALVANLFPRCGWIIGFWSCFLSVLIMGGRLQGDKV